MPEQLIGTVVHYFKGPSSPSVSRTTADLDHGARGSGADDGIPRSLPEHRIADERRGCHPHASPADGLDHSIDGLDHSNRYGAALARGSVIQLTSPAT